jgi:hypothetical protein
VQLNMTVIQNTAKTATSKAGKPYKLQEIAYKNLDNGKVEEAKINQYSDLYKIAADMQAGMSFSVTKEKINDFWTWTKVEMLTPGSAPTASTEAPKAAAYKSTYETPEERAKKQGYIIRQSCLSNAVATWAPGDSTGPEICALAQTYVDWVLNVNSEFSIEEQADPVVQ